VGLAYALLVGECVVILVPSIYGHIAPKLFGIPFFYWFQLMWILAAMVVTGVAYLLLRERGPGQTDAPGIAGADAGAAVPRRSAGVPRATPRAGDAGTGEPTGTDTANPTSTDADTGPGRPDLGGRR
jgi:hypothetical protein